jgi:hypothetical protein
MRDLADIHDPDAEQIGAMPDNLSTHTARAWYETFPLPEAHRILQRLEFHYIPKHASWLNMVPIEIGVRHGQCLDRRIGEHGVLVFEIDAWQRQRNASGARIKSKFTTSRRAASWRGPVSAPPTGQNYCDQALARLRGFADFAAVHSLLINEMDERVLTTSGGVGDRGGGVREAAGAAIGTRVAGSGVGVLARAGCSGSTATPVRLSSADGHRSSE